MKKLVFIMTVIFALTLSACSSSKLSSDYSESDVISRAKEIVEIINTLDYSAVNAEMRSDLQEVLTVEKLEHALAEPLGKAGAFSDYTTVTVTGQKSKSTGEDYATAVLVCEYENSSITYVISMDKNMDIVGINIR